MTFDAPDETPPEDPYATPDQEQAEAAAALEAPHSVEAEKEVLGSVMLRGEVLHDVLAVCAPSDFYLPRHELILDAIATLARSNRPYGVVAVQDELERRGHGTKAGGIEYLFTLTSVPSTAANAGYHAQIVAEHAVRRRLIEVATRSLQAAQSLTSDAPTLLAQAREDLEAAAGVTIHKPRRAIDGFAALVETVSTTPDAVPTPWLELDRLLGGGLRPGQLIVVGARPGQGKSVVGLQIAGSLAQYGPVGFVSLEMQEKELLMRLSSAIGTIPFSALRNSALTETDWNSMKVVKQVLDPLPLFIADDPNMRLPQIEAYARRLAAEGNLQGLVVDYLQLMKAGGDYSNRRQEEVAELSRRLKLLAQALQVPVVALSQLNRQGSSRGGRGQQQGGGAPQLTDLRESGAIEQDADVVILLHRQSEDSTDLGMHVAKHRGGRQGRIVLEWQGGFMRAVSASKSVGQEPFAGMEEDHHER